MENVVKGADLSGRGPPHVTRDSGCKQQAPSPMGFIGRKSGADTTSSEIYWKEIWYSQNQQEAEGTRLEKGKTKGTQTVELWSKDEDDEEMVEPKVGQDSELENQDKKQEVKEAPPRELTEEEKQQILHSEEFLIFFDRTIRVIERALAEDSDIFFDYSGRELEEKDGDVQAGANLSFNRQFYDEHWSKHRVVTCMDWSLQFSNSSKTSFSSPTLVVLVVMPSTFTLLNMLSVGDLFHCYGSNHHYPELMVASYNNNEDAPHEPDGVALVWNMKFKKTTPEYVFHCQIPTIIFTSSGDQKQLGVLNSTSILTEKGENFNTFKLWG
ncbi:hypothetical protein J1605_002148 [Eschrichtius robustus]|uniref:Uncharacterized protein n=1 Tax=Eschrichtius robustus TaxID=9764 RepID=A0AB34I084_ESCRO|nr:hypothetical protein J1605_002148 [Eschrichtius robustus]